MLITVSGMVGSGKSTAARQLAETLSAAGIECRVQRFRTLRLLPFDSAAAPRRSAKAEAAPTAVRWAGFRPRPLKVSTACGYAIRVLAFRVFGRMKESSSCQILDRYFYDNLVHYQLRTARERFYAAVLRRLIPVPDLAILLVASEQTLLARRPNYSREYVADVSPAYDRLQQQVPQLIRVCTDLGPQAAGEVAALARHLINVHPEPREAAVRKRAG
jgi:thymidylate kinase